VASLEHSLDIKRQTLGVVDSISAEDIGKLRIRTWRNHCKRVPGVSIDRDQGEGRFITVRGFRPGIQYSPFERSSRCRRLGILADDVL